MKSTVLAIAINPLRQQVHQELQDFAGCQNLRCEPAYLPAGREVSVVDGASEWRNASGE